MLTKLSLEFLNLRYYYEDLGADEWVVLNGSKLNLVQK
jgi:hypothetical protein